MQVVQQGRTSSASSRRRSGTRSRPRAQLKVKWDDTPTLPGNGNLDGALARSRRTCRRRPSPSTPATSAPALASAAKIVSASYFTAYQSHGALGPNCSVADVSAARRATVLCIAQGPYCRPAAGDRAARSGCRPTSVRVEVFPGSGTYGHSTYDDVSISAALLSQAVGKPVRVQFMRWDEHGWDQFGPAQATDIRAGIDANGQDRRLRLHRLQPRLDAGRRVGGPARRHRPLPRRRAGRDRSTRRAPASFYKIPNRRVTSKSVNGYGGVPEGHLAARARRAAGAVRLRADDRRARARGEAWTRSRSGSRTSTPPRRTATAAGSPCSNAVAKAANWKPKVVGVEARSGERRHRAAASRSAASRTPYPAIVADITRQQEDRQDHRRPPLRRPGRRHHRQPGLGREPDGGLPRPGRQPRADRGGRASSKVAQTSLDWVTYPILRFKDAPKVTTVVVQRLDQPSAGSGEPTTAAVAGRDRERVLRRDRRPPPHMPMTPGQVRAALAAA